MGASERDESFAEDDDEFAASADARWGGTARWEHAGRLFERWLDGEARAMDELVRLLTPVLWHVVRACGLDHGLAEDVVQTTWLALLRKGESISDPKAVSGWLTVSARREAWRVARLHRRDVIVEASEVEPRLTHAPSAEHEAVASDEARRLWAAVERLTDRCRRLLRVIAFDERPDYARIASDLKMPIGSIGPTRQRCLAKLRVLIEGQDQGVSA